MNQPVFSGLRKHFLNAIESFTNTTMRSGTSCVVTIYMYMYMDRSNNMYTVYTLYMHDIVHVALFLLTVSLPSQSLTSADPSSLTEVGEASSSLTHSLYSLMEAVREGGGEGEGDMKLMKEAYEGDLAMAKVLQRYNVINVMRDAEGRKKEAN